MNFSKAILLLAFMAVFGAANGSGHKRTLKGSSDPPVASAENTTTPPLSTEEQCAIAMEKEDCVMACFGMT